MPLIEINEISKVYGFGDATTVALDEVSLNVNKGEFLAVMGPSGSGKTTLMNIIGLLDRPTHGVYKLSDKPVARMTRFGLARRRRDNIGFIFQSFNLLPKLTIIENVALPLAYKGMMQKRRLKAAERALAQVGLRDKEYNFPNQLSGGQLQRAAIARALVNGPNIIIADEPTGNLDSVSARVVMELLSEIHKMGNTVLMVTHNPSLTRYADRIIYMLDGSIVYDEATAVGEVPDRVQRAVRSLRRSSDDENLANVSAMIETMPEPPAAPKRKKKTKVVPSKTRKEAASQRVKAMIFEHLKMAMASVRSAKLRSTLTMFGIIIGVSSVMMIVGLGEGVKRQVAVQVSEVSDALLVIRPGKRASEKPFGFDSLKVLTLSSGSLSEKDWRDTEKVAGVVSAVPVGIVSGVASYNETEFSSGSIIASTSRLPVLLNQRVEYGEFFDPENSSRSVAVIGKSVAEQLFKENVPIGKNLSIRGKSYIVQGVFEQQKSGTFSELNLNTAVVIPYDAARELGGTIQLIQVYVEAESSEKVASVADSLHQTLKSNHAGQTDFMILQKEEALEATNAVFYQLTVFIAGVAFISFIVGGIGIMNIMFATVSERTREIGIRKAIGATNAQILGQFVMESIVLSLVGGAIGVAIAFIGSGIVRVTTDLQPVITLRVIALVTGLSMLTGVVSGLLPAAKAARKDPIDSLRREN